MTCPKMGSAADALVAPTTAKEFRFATHVYTVVQPFVCEILLDVFCEISLAQNNMIKHGEESKNNGVSSMVI